MGAVTPDEFTARARELFKQRELARSAAQEIWSEKIQPLLTELLRRGGKAHSRLTWNDFQSDTDIDVEHYAKTRTVLGALAQTDQYVVQYTVDAASSNANETALTFTMGSERLDPGEALVNEELGDALFKVWHIECSHWGRLAHAAHEALKKLIES